MKLHSLLLRRTLQRWYMNPVASGILALQLVTTITKRFRVSAPHRFPIWSNSEAPVIFFWNWRNFRNFRFCVEHLPFRTNIAPNLHTLKNPVGLSKGFLIATLHGFFERAENRDLFTKLTVLPRGREGWRELDDPKIGWQSKHNVKNRVILRVCALFGIIKMVKTWKVTDWITWSAVFPFPAMFLG